MMLGVPEEARAPLRCYQFSADGCGVQLLQNEQQYYFQHHLLRKILEPKWANETRSEQTEDIKTKMPMPCYGYKISQ